MTTKILIVDDHKVMRTMIIKMLDPTLFAPLEASNGEEALQLIKSHSDIKWIICDLNMPLMTGLQFLNAKSQIPNHEEMAVIIVTSNRNEEILKKCRDYHVAGILIKPFRKESLDEILTKQPQLMVCNSHSTDSSKAIPRRG